MIIKIKKIFKIDYPRGRAIGIWIPLFHKAENLIFIIFPLCQSSD